MGLRKRSAKFGSDKWLGVALHNMLVDADRESKAKAELKKRLAAIRRKLRGADIDESWAEVTLDIMSSYGYGLNQFSNRVLPLLRERMRDCAHAEDRKARAAELRRIDADNRKTTVLEAKRQEADCRRARLQVNSDVKIAKDNAAKVTWLDPGFDIEGTKSKALASTFDELSSDMRTAKKALDDEFSSLPEVRLAVSKSLFLDYSTNGFFKCLFWLGADVLVAYSTLHFVNALVKGVEPNLASVLAIMFAFVAIPVVIIRHLIWLGQPKIKLSMPFVVSRYQSHFLTRSAGQGVMPPAIGKQEIPQDILDGMKEINLALRTALKRRSA